MTKGPHRSTRRSSDPLSPQSSQRRNEASGLTVHELRLPNVNIVISYESANSALKRFMDDLLTLARRYSLAAICMESVGTPSSETAKPSARQRTTKPSPHSGSPSARRSTPRTSNVEEV